MSNTPFFPAWRPRLAPMGSRTAQVFHRVRAYTLAQLESCFAAWVPAHLFPKAASKENSRDRVYTRGRTFWCLLWQSFNPEASGREVVRQLQALFCLVGGPVLSEEDGAYCRAKARLAPAEFPKALAATAQAADKLVRDSTALQGRPVKVVDGSSVTLNDTPKNRKTYPPLPHAVEPNFPQLRIVVLFSLLSGAILAMAQGSLVTSELALLHLLASQLAAKDILVGDQGFGSYPVLAWLQHYFQVDFIGRSARRADGRHRLRRLGKSDWLMLWKKHGTPSPWLSLAQWLGLPTQLTVRVLKGRCHQKGFRSRQLTLVTTLLDAELYPAQEILQAYLRRWRLEMCLDDLKTTLKMETLRGRSPEMVEKEIYARLLVHNLVRCLMAQAAAQGQVPLVGISFKGSLDALRQFALAMTQARSKKKRQELWRELLRTLAADLLPERPDRQEPRAVKRQKNKYPHLSRPRRQFKDRPKRNTRRTNARLRKLGLM